MASDETGAERYLFQPLRQAHPYWGDTVPQMVDLTNATPSLRADVTDAVDLVAVRAVIAVGGSVALWRAFRRPDADSDALSYRAYVVQVEDPDWVVDVVATVTAAIGDDDDVVVERFTSGPDASAHTVAAILGGALLWVSEHREPMMVVRLFDNDPETGPAWSDDHPLLSHEETQAVSRYLDSATPLTVTSAVSVDHRDPAQGMVVPMSFRTDGWWIWCDAVAYYLRTHNLAPEPAFLDHIRRAGPLAAPLTLVQVHRAFAALSSPISEKQA